jgi:predicted Zn finger-like uncharacterized protein
MAVQTIEIVRPGGRIFEVSAEKIIATGVLNVRCQKCGHVWIPRNQRPEDPFSNLPVHCPVCKDKLWFLGPGEAVRYKIVKERRDGKVVALSPKELQKSVAPSQEINADSTPIEDIEEESKSKTETESKTQELEAEPIW